MLGEGNATTFSLALWVQSSRRLWVWLERQEYATAPFAPSERRDGGPREKLAVTRLDAACSVQHREAQLKHLEESGWCEKQGPSGCQAAGQKAPANCALGETLHLPPTPPCKHTCHRTNAARLGWEQGANVPSVKEPSSPVPEHCGSL